MVSRIVPLQTQLDIDLLTLLKCSYLGHKLTKNEASVNFSTYHTPFSDQRELIYSRKTKDLSLVEIHSFTDDDSDLCTIAQTTQQTKEDTSLALELLCDLFTPLPSVCDTSQQSLPSSLVLLAKLLAILLRQILKKDLILTFRLILTCSLRSSDSLKLTSY